MRWKDASMNLFELPLNNGKSSASDIVKRALNEKKKKTPNMFLKNKKGTQSQDVSSRIASISSMIERQFQELSESYTLVTNKEELDVYIDRCIQNRSYALDTETSGLDPMRNEIAGFSLYTPGQRAIYVPINHLSYVTMGRIKEQITPEEATVCLKRLEDVDFGAILFNAVFDIRVIKNQLGVRLPCDWDAFVAAHMLNENEPSKKLKVLYQKYCCNGEGDALSYDEIFDDINFQFIPPKVGFLYAAHDAEITYKLYEFQKPYLTEECDLCKDYELQDVANVYKNIEIPLIDVNVDLEDTGVYFDTSKSDELSKTFNSVADQKEVEFHNQCSGELAPAIVAYRRIMGDKCKLSEPINISSPIQIGILLYDILGITPPGINKRAKRSTDEATLKLIDHPICKIVLDYREMKKLTSTFVDTLPTLVNPYDHRLHARFNACGTVTGRFSSSNPNLQQIPSKGVGKVVREMFIASPGYIMMSSDFSAQEPRITAHMANDSRMVDAYIQGKDLYCLVASIAFGVPYEECLETRDGVFQPEGKKKRSTAKAIVLGVCYGKGIKAIGEDLGISKQKAQQIYDTIMSEFPGLKKFVDDCHNMAHKCGYVTTVYGRKRRLPECLKPNYEFSYDVSHGTFYDPLSPTTNEVENNKEVDYNTKRFYVNKLNKVWGRDKEAIRNEALSQGIIIKDNSGDIAKAERESVNARIQGTAADITKLAMIHIHNDKRLSELGFKMLIPVHDEIIGECPLQNAKEAGIRLAQIMIESANGLRVPFKCDTTWFDCWTDHGEDVDTIDDYVQKKLQEGIAKTENM